MGSLPPRRRVRRAGARGCAAARPLPARPYQATARQARRRPRHAHRHPRRLAGRLRRRPAHQPAGAVAGAVGDLLPRRRRCHRRDGAVDRHRHRGRGAAALVDVPLHPDRPSYACDGREPAHGRPRRRQRRSHRPRQLDVVELSRRPRRCVARSGSWWSAVDELHGTARRCRCRRRRRQPAQPSVDFFRRPPPRSGGGAAQRIPAVRPDPVVRTATCVPVRRAARIAGVPPRPAPAMGAHRRSARGLRPAAGAPCVHRRGSALPPRLRAGRSRCSWRRSSSRP